MLTAEALIGPDQRPFGILHATLPASDVSNACVHVLRSVLLFFVPPTRIEPRTSPGRRRFACTQMSAPAGQRPIMPRPSFPPTPAPSTDITGKTNANAGPFDNTFVLPPAAISASRASIAASIAASTASTASTIAESSSSSSNASDSSYRPLSPPSPAATTKPAPAARKRPASSQAVVTKDDYSLPPPPTRSRKIIQMKPKDSQDQPRPADAPAMTAKAAPVGGAAGVAGAKKKQPGNTTAAGRKIARKTAHSLIERRRRSKMNEEFGVLKDMIPACAGQEMHKLAILQVRF